MTLQNVTLELSSKPFTDDSRETMESVSRTMFRQWQNLLDKADRISVLLWIADGSEILEYTGDLSQTFEWAYWFGCANHIPPSGNETEREKINTHKFPKKYRDDAAPRPYQWLKELIGVIKSIGLKLTGKPIRIGAIFDNGPEFAISNFKYKKHPEIARANTLFPGSFVTCNSTLNSDPQPYAAFPNGIAQGTTLGEFLGKQFKVFADDLGYDYIWLSNGMGFGTETWGITGALFDKEKFYPEKADEAAGTMLHFWNDFTRYWPKDKIETRGSNFSAGLELSTDAAPLKELYRDFKIAPPVNSPWAALNYNSGLELAAWMSHVAELPDERFPYRFYAHDPWFYNSPWLDRYGREPWDIYLPLSICRINEQAEAQTPNSISILTIDDTLGQMPEQVPDEVIPHLKEALRHAPDQAGPLVWVYPFSEYSDLVRGKDKNPGVVFNEDMFIAEALQQGLPLNTVISTDNFYKTFSKCPEKFASKILIAPVTSYPAVKGFIASGGNVIFYGSLRNVPDDLCQLLHLNNDVAITGEAVVELYENVDQCEHDACATTTHIHDVFNCGGACEVIADSTDTNVIAEVKAGNQKRILASVRKFSKTQKVAFVRSLLPCAKDPKLEYRGFEYGKADEIFFVEKLMRYTLCEFGWKLGFNTVDVSSHSPRICISRNDNAFYYSVFSPETGTEITTSSPYGAPILTEMQCRIESDMALWHPSKAWHKECRCFIRQKDASMVDCKIVFPAYPQYHQRREYHNLKDAEVTFFPPINHMQTLEAIITKEKNQLGGFLSKDPVDLEWHEDGNGKHVVLKNVTGYLSFIW